MDLVVKSKISPRSGSVALKLLKPIHKKGAQILSLTLAKTLGKLRKINGKKQKKNIVYHYLRAVSPWMKI